MKKSLLLKWAFFALLVAALAFTGCPDGNDPTSESGTGGVFRSPFFLVHPTSFDVPAGSAIPQLRAEVRERGGGVSHTFQWFRVDGFSNTGGTAIPGATGATFTPTEDGYFYVVATAISGDQRLSSVSHPARIRVGAAPVEASTLVITDSQRQYIRGFGGMSNAFGIGMGEGAGPTPQDAYMMLHDIETMFDPEGQLAFNIFRIHIFPAPLSDVISGVYQEGMALSNRDFVAHARRVTEHGGYVVAAPWTPPFPHWKANNHLYGSPTPSHLLDQFYRAYAEYLRDWATEMARMGGPISVISLQNEPTFPAEYYGMLWSGEQHRRFLAEYGHIITGTPARDEAGNVIPGTGHAGVPGAGGNIDGRRRSNQRVLLQGGTPHNDVTWNNTALNDTRAREQLEVVGYHTYGAWNVRHALSLDGAPRRETWMMEKNVNSADPANQALDATWDLIWIVMNEIHHVITHNDSSVYTWWYLKRWYSMIGEGAFGTTNGAILPRGYGMGHFSRFLTDTVRLDAFFSPTIPQAIGLGPSAGMGRLNPGQAQTAAWSEGAGAGIRVLSGMRTSRPSTIAELPMADVDLSGIKNQEDMVSLLLMDTRTNAPGQSTDIRVQLPQGFTATSAYGIISDSTDARHAPVLVALEPEGESALVNLPSNAMISLRFRGQWD